MSTEPLTVLSPNEEETTAGNYFVSNYPPYSFWTPDRVADAYAALDRPPRAGTPLGVYLHIPFCRKRCHFCYFKVYTDKNAEEIEAYLDAAVSGVGLIYPEDSSSAGASRNSSISAAALRPLYRRSNWSAWSSG